MRRCKGPDGRDTGRARHPCRTPLLVLLAALAAASVSAGAGKSDEPDANILETRSRVAAMAEEAIDMLEGEITLEGVEGWAVFTGDTLPPDLGAGIGMAESIEGEAWFLHTPAPRCLSKGYRHVLIFRNEDAFREFRQGQLHGDRLDRLPDQTFTAYRFRPAGSIRLEPMTLDGCRFALHRDLQRALVAEPSETKGLLDDKDVDVDEN